MEAGHRRCTPPAGASSCRSGTAAAPATRYFNDGAQPVGPSPIAITNNEVRTADGKQPYVTPASCVTTRSRHRRRFLAKAAANAKAAGFGRRRGNGANGYLLDEFLRDGANRRSGPYGGPSKTAPACSSKCSTPSCERGADRVGLRISPLNSFFNSMIDSDPAGPVSWLGKRLNACQARLPARDARRLPRPAARAT